MNTNKELLGAADAVVGAIGGDISASVSLTDYLIRVGIVLLIALVVGGIFCRRVLPRMAKAARARNHSAVAILCDALESPLFALAIVIVLYFAVLAAPIHLPVWVSDIARTLHRVILLLCITWFGWNCTPLCHTLMQRFAPASISGSALDTASGFLRYIWRVILLMLASISLLETMGFNVSSLIAGLGLAGLTISLAAQSSANDFFCGLIIVLERPISVGDWVRIGDVEGEVESVNLRSTKIRQLDRGLVTLSNSAVCDGTVENYSRRPSRIYDFKLGVTYDTTRPMLEKLMVDIEAMLKADPKVESDTVLVKLWGFGDSSIDILVRCHIATPALADFAAAQNNLNLKLMDVMEKNGCSFAFPSTSVYVETMPKKD